MSRIRRTSLAALLLTLTACSSGTQGSEVSATEAAETESTAGDETSTTADPAEATSAEASSDVAPVPSARDDEPSATSEEGAQANSDVAESPAGDGPVEEMPLLAGPDGGNLGRTDRFPSVVRVGRVETYGALAPEPVTRVVRTRVPAVHRCYDVALTRDDTLAGTLRVRFIITAEGRVAHIQPAESAVNEEALYRCVATALRTLRFPAQSARTIVVLPIMLRPR